MTLTYTTHTRPMKNGLHRHINEVTLSHIATKVFEIVRVLRFTDVTPTTTATVPQRPAQEPRHRATYSTKDRLSFGVDRCWYVHRDVTVPLMLN